MQYGQNALNRNIELITAVQQLLLIKSEIFLEMATTMVLLLLCEMQHITALQYQMGEKRTALTFTTYLSKCAIIALTLRSFNVKHYPVKV